MEVPGIWPYAYLMMSMTLLLVWLVLYGVRTDPRHSMPGVSLAIALLGLTEPLFVPMYWNPFTP